MSLSDRPTSESSAIKSGSSRFWNDPDKRALMFQILLVLGLAAFLLSIINNTLSNLEQRGITTGFAFLDVEAGFGILQSLIPYTETDTYGRTFFVGLLNTVLVSVLGIIAATVLGFFLGVGRLSKNWLISKVCTVYIEIFRNIPLLLQIFFWYFTVLRTLPSPRQSLEFLGSFLNVRGLYLPQPVGGEGFNVVWVMFFAGLGATWLLKRWANKRQEVTGQDFPMLYAGLGLIFGLPLIAFFLMGMPMTVDHPVLTGFNFVGGITIIPEFMALWLALTIYTAAFIAEIVRGGILSVPHGQLEAATALGLPRSKTLRFIILPQALRVIIPPLTSQYLNLTKNSSLATAIGYPDLVSVFAGTTLNQTGQAIEVIFMTMAVYLTLSILTSIFMNWYNSRKALIER
ncbi:amino acid ABC transporter permease [Neptunomonas antarctica]|uniref:Amino acid ABC transporter membrane protein 1, PAAT family n=1 Tax=Neptunomonas antarctica TaxID=619304 RepID=A0A1N7M7M9_9GAMM|nr:amino acid ABC transporter permease [Neptunomonas antarctica]SIS82115.1 amino acid ABC transporter membrane protein 1, PAAT family [Neptunomonas antarctica]